MKLNRIFSGFLYFLLEKKHFPVVSSRQTKQRAVCYVYFESTSSTRMRDPTVQTEVLDRLQLSSPLSVLGNRYLSEEFWLRPGYVVSRASE